MGQEVKTTLRFDGRILEGMALLETDSIIFRGGVSLTVKFSEIFKIEANAGWLDLQTGRGLLLFELGPKAEVWAEKIKNPKALVEKLGVDAHEEGLRRSASSTRISVPISTPPARRSRRARAARTSTSIFVAASSKKDLEKLAEPCAR